MATILVTAASSQLGQAAVEHLLTLVKDPSSIAVTVRDPKKVPASWKGVDVRTIDYADSPDRWAEATQGIEKVLIISSLAMGDERVQQHTNIVEGAKKSSVKLVAYTSILNGEKSTLALAPDHIRTEAMIKSSGVPYVFLRNGWYTENYLQAKGSWEHAGKQLSSAGDAKFSTAERKDYGQAAAVVVSPGYHGKNEALELAGDGSFTYNELAAFVSEKLGKTVSVEQVTPEEYEKVLIGMGLPQHLAHVFPLIDVEAEKGALFNDSKTLSKILGRPTTPWRDTVAAAL